MIVYITAEAENDLEQIGDYIAQDNPKRALSFVVELRDKCLSLADTPNGFPLVSRYERHGIRRRVHGNRAYPVHCQMDGAMLNWSNGRTRLPDIAARISAGLPR